MAKMRACVWDFGVRVFTWYDDGTAVLWFQDGGDEQVFEDVYSLKDFNDLLMDYWMTPLGTGKKNQKPEYQTALLPF
jgi:hypothetical protein